MQAEELSFSARGPGPGKAHFPPSLEISDIQHHIYKTSAMFSHLLKCPYFLASKQEVILTQILELSRELSSSLVPELLSSKTQVHSVPTKDPDACQEKQHSSCIFASVLQAFQYHFEITTYGNL